MPTRLTSMQRLLLILCSAISGPAVAYILPHSTNSGLQGVPLLLIGAATYLYIAREAGWRRTGWLAIILGLYSFGAELLGTETGFPYGHFSYSALLGPQIAGLPIGVLFVWPIVILSSITLWKNKRLLPVWGGIAALLFDVVIEPTAIRLGYWSWQETGFYHGAPLSNFVGWFLFGAIGSTLAAIILGKKLNKRHRRWSYGGLYTLGLLAWIGLWQGLYWQAAIACICLVAVPYVWERNGMYRRAYIKVLRVTEPTPSGKL
jgi:uncharacterized membrane protein